MSRSARSEAKAVRASAEWTAAELGVSMGPSGRSLLVGAASVASLLVIWSWAASGTLTMFLPSPWDVWEGTVLLASDGRLQQHLLASYLRVLAGWALGGIVGAALGLLAGRSRLVTAALAPYVNFFRFVPPIALASLAVIWLGIGEKSKVGLIFYASAFLVFLTVAAGSAAVHPYMIRAAQCMGASPLRIFFRVILPATMPSIATGLRVAMSNSFSAVVAAELIAAQTGIGFLIFSSRLLGRTDFVFVGVLFLGLMGFLADLVFRSIVTRVAYRYEIHV